MIAGLKSYPRMKDSGIPWIHRIPASWESRRIRDVTDLLVSNVDKHSLAHEAPVRLCNYLDVYRNRAISGSLDFMKATASTDEIRKFRLQLGDVLLTKDSEDWQDIAVPAVVEFESSDLVCGYHLAILRPRSSVNGAFLNSAVASHWISSQFHVSATGITRYGISKGAINGVVVPVPPRDEQEAIVRFLDYANQRIDRFVRSKRKLIALLDEQKQAIINQAVTRGLDPDASLKPSGIPWLGDIPAHWEVQRIGRLAKVGNGSTPSRSNASYWRGGHFPWLNSSQVNRGFVDSSDQFVTSAALKECHLPVVPANSVLIAITGQGKTRGTAAILGFDATINQHVAYITPRPSSIMTDYLQLTLVAAYATLRSISDDSGSTKGALTCGDLKRFRLPIPPLAEQELIARTVDLRTQAIRRVVTRTEHEISLVEEYRTRLISDVVTGQLDVREAVIPDQLEEDSTLGELLGGDTTGIEEQPEFSEAEA